MMLEFCEGGLGTVFVLKPKWKGSPKSQKATFYGDKIYIA